MSTTVSSFTESTVIVLENFTEAAETNQQTTEEGKVPKIAALIVLMVLNIVGNTSVCVVVLRDRELRLTVRNLALASLAWSDLLMIQIILFRILSLLKVFNDFSLNACVVFARLYGILVYVSILHLFILSIDKYVAVFYPLRYAHKVTVRRLFMVLALVWVIPSIAVGVVPKVLEGKSKLRFHTTFMECIYFPANNTSERQRINTYLNAVILFGIPLFCMLVTYFKIARVSWYQSNRVDYELRDAEARPCSRRIRARETKWAKTIGIMIGAFILCYLPIIVILLHQASTGLDPTASEAILYLSFINTVINPVIYCLRSREYRKAFTKMCMKRNVILATSTTTQETRDRNFRRSSTVTNGGRKRDREAWCTFKVEDSSEVSSTSTSFSFVISRALFQLVLTEVLEGNTNASQND